MHITSVQQGNPIPLGEGVYLNNVFSPEQWDALTTLVNDIAAQPDSLEKVAYGKGALENKKFSLSLYKFISRINNVSSINNTAYTEKLLDILNHSPIMSQINTLNNKKLNILRLQLNIMTEDGYVGRHSDYESDNAYFCSVLIRIDKNYTGGDLIMFDKNGKANHFNQDDRTILAMSAFSEHEVDIVKSGVRNTLCLFCG